MQELVDERLIVAASVSHHAPGLPLERALRVLVTPAVPPLVAEGHSVGLVPRSVAGPAAVQRALACVPTAGLIAPQRLTLAWNAVRPRSMQCPAFCDAAVQGFLDAAPSASHARAACAAPRVMR